MRACVLYENTVAAGKQLALAQAAKVVNQQIISIIYTPASAAQALVSNLKQLVREVAVSPREAIGLARVFFRFGSELPLVPYTTQARKQQSVNQDAMVKLVAWAGNMTMSNSFLQGVITA